MCRTAVRVHPKIHDAVVVQVNRQGMSEWRAPIDGGAEFVGEQRGGRAGRRIGDRAVRWITDNRVDDGIALCKCLLAGKQPTGGRGERNQSWEGDTHTPHRTRATR